LKTVRIALFILAVAALGAAQKKAEKSATVVFKDGHQKTVSIASGSRIEFRGDAMLVNNGGHQESIPLADIVRIDFGDQDKSRPLDRNHFVGKWEFGEGNGDTFAVELKADGEAHKDHGAPHGTWVFVEGEARISWDDGWHDVIRRVGDKHEKFAFEPGHAITDAPSNVSTARRTNSESM
jgi:hypothetical protein